jgi:G3E family GTPase
MSDPFVTAHYKLEQVITALDAVNAMTTLDQHDEAVKQVAVADRLLLTKTDLAKAVDLQELRQRITALNPAAPLVTVLNGAVAIENFFGSLIFDVLGKPGNVQGWLRVEAYDEENGQHADAHSHSHEHEHAAVDRNRHDDHISSYSVIREQPISWAGFSAWLEMISQMRGDDLLRVKGIVNVIEHPDRPVVIHGVQHLFHPPVFFDQWPSDDHRTRLVFITRDMDREDIDATLQVFENRKPRSSRPS